MAQFYEADGWAIQRLLENYGAELEENGYELFRGTWMKNLRAAFLGHFGSPDVTTQMWQTYFAVRMNTLV